MTAIRLSAPADVPALIDIWRRSVRATHDFLSEQDFIEIDRLVSQDYLPATPVWVAVGEQERPVAFMGLSPGHVDSLFIDPDFRGRGIGREMLAHARTLEGPLTVEVNEQNGQAVGFYEKMGFVQVGRSLVDGDGRPYPTLRLSQRG